MFDHGFKFKLETKAINFNLSLSVKFIFKFLIL